MPIFEGRVTHLVSGDLWGGAEAMVFALALEQHRLRPGSVACVVMNPGRLAILLEQAGIPTTILDEGQQGFSILLRQVRKHIKLFRPHVLHAHRQKENLLAALVRLTSRAAPRCVTTVHGMPEPRATGAILRRLGIELTNAAVMRHGLNAIVTVSLDMAGMFKKAYPGTRVLCIHNGTGIQITSNRHAVPTPRPLQLLALGRLVTIKRFERLRPLSDAIMAAQNARPVITLAGDGPLDSQLRDAFTSDGAVETVRMIGFAADVTDLLEETDALVMTSDHEGIPMAVLEALARGVPVFAFDVGGLPEIAATNVPLHLVPKGDVGALAREIVQFFTVNSLGTRIPPPPAWSFDIRECARAYDRLYGEV
jgi:glycosyltransferase involved in cell wall biosynthesis